MNTSEHPSARPLRNPKAPPVAPAWGLRSGGLGQAVLSTLDTMRPSLLSERLIDRLDSAQERVALLTAALTKAVAARDEGQLLLERMRSDERLHCEVLRRHLVRLGFDPAFAPPSREGGDAKRILQIITNPRTSVSQALCALLGAALAGVGDWQTLARTAREAHEEGMAAEFEAIRAVAETHVHRIRERAEAVASE
jgi:rubrerythrin